MIGISRPPAKLDLFESAYRDLRRDYARIQKQTTKISQQWIDELSKLKPIQAEYNSLRDKTPQIGAQAKLEQESHNLETEIRALRAILEPIRTQIEKLHSPSTTFPQLLQEAERARTKLEESEERLGTKTQIEQQYSQAIQEAKNLETQIETLQKYLDELRFESSRTDKPTAQARKIRSR